MYMPSMIGLPPPPCSTMPAAEVGEAVLLGVPARLSSSMIMWSSWRCVTERPRWPCRRNGNEPITYVWKWYMRYRPTRPDEFADLGAQQQPRCLPRAARDDHDPRAHLVRVAVERRDSARRARVRRRRRAARARRRTRAGSRSDRCAARCAAARPDRPWPRSGSRSTPQKPQLLHAGRPSYGTELTPVGAGYGL